MTSSRALSVMEGRTTTCVSLELQKLNTENENRNAVKSGKRKEKRKNGTVFEKADEQKTSSNSYHTASSIYVLKDAENSSENSKVNKKENRNKNEIEKENKIKNKNNDEIENRNKSLLDITESTENQNDEKNVMCLGAKTKDVKGICVEIPSKIPGIPGGSNSFEGSTAHVNSKKNYNACSTVLKKLVNSTEDNYKQFQKKFTTALSDCQTVLKRKEIKTDNDLIKLSVIEGMLSEEIHEINKHNRSFFKPHDKRELNHIASNKINQSTVNPGGYQLSGVETVEEKYDHIELEPQEKIIEKEEEEADRKIIPDKKDMYGIEECIYFYKEPPSVSESKEITSYEETKQCNIAPECLNTTTDIKHIKDAINLTYKKYKHNRIPRRRLAKLLRSFNYVDHKTPKDDKSCQTNLNISFHERELDIQLSVITNLHNIVFKEREKIKELKDLMQYTTSEIEKENNKLYEELSLYKTKYNRLKSQISSIGYGSILNMQEKPDIQKGEHKDCVKNWEEDSSNNLSKGKYTSGSTCEEDYVIVNSIRQCSLKKEKDVKLDNRNLSSCALLKFIDF